jgi:predicted transcriptional regulator
MKDKSFTTPGVNNLESLVPSLRQLGLSLNESKAYLCLLEKSGITAYEMSKNAGVPPSKIYDSLGKLTYCKVFVISSIMRLTKLEALD